MRRLTVIIGFLLFVSIAHAQTATVTWGSTLQPIDGFYGQDWLFADSLTGANADKFFDPSSGIGLNVRTMNTWDGGIPDIVTLQSAVARGALVELSLQSPPCSLKWSFVNNGESCTQGGDAGSQPPAFNDGSVSSNGTCFTSNQSLATSFALYSTYIVNYITTLKNAPNNVPIAVLDVQNEPDISSGIGACLWGNGANFQNFIKNFLGPAMASAGLSSVKIMLGSSSGWFNADFTSACLSDPSCAPYVSIASGHGYGYPFSPYVYTPGISNGKHVWMSETSYGSTWDTSISSALTMAQNLFNFWTVAQISDYQWWELAYDPSSGNFGLADSSFNGTKRFYAMGNWSKFCRPGSVAISATANPVAGVDVTACKNVSTGKYDIQAINTNGTGTSVTFNLSGFPTTASVTPWITDASRNLAQQSNIGVSGNAFSTTLAANSVTTFDGVASGGGGPATLYITQSGGGTGSGCGDPISAAQFNADSSAAPGSAFHLCGAFNGTAGGTMLFLPASGGIGNPDQLICETGCSLSAPYWLNGGSGAGGAINTAFKANWIISGGPDCGFAVTSLTTVTCNGIIQNTANGTGLANQQPSIGVEVFNSNNIVVKNWQFLNMYNRSGTATDPNPTDPNTIQAVKIDGTSNGVTLLHNSMNNDSWAIDATGGTDNVTITGNDIFNNCHSIALSSAHWTINGNHFHDWANWNSGAFNICHEDGVHCYVNNTAGNTQLGQLYNNYFDGSTGTNAQQYFFPEGSGSSSVCVVPGGKLYVYNNVAIQNLSPGSSQEAMLATYGNATTGDIGDVYANNTLIGTVATNSDPSTSAMIFQNSTSLTAANNAVGAGGVLISGFTFTATTFDHNAYQNCGAGNCFSPTGIDTSSFSAWQAFHCTGSSNSCDQNGIASLGSSTYFTLPAGCVPGSLAQNCAPQSGSPLISAGANLTSLCSGDLAALCTDIAGNPRPTSGAWDIGAYQSTGTPPTPGTPHGLRVISIQ